MTDHLHALAMRTKAANEAQSWVKRAMCLSQGGYEIERNHGHMVAKASDAILALPLEADHAALLAEAVKLPEIAALVEAIKAEIEARNSLLSTAPDRGGSHGPKGQRKMALENAQLATVFALAALETP